MIYFSTKKDLVLIKELLDKFEKITSIEQDSRKVIKDKNNNFLTSYAFLASVREESKKINPTYQDLRASYAKLIPIANNICNREQVNWYKYGKAAILEGGGTFEGSIFEFVLNRPSDILDFDTDVRDTINQVIGALEYKKDQEFKQFVNPLYWLKEVIIFIVRLPFNVLRLSGFNVEKIEDHLIGKAVQLIYVVAIILIFIYFGFDINSGLINLLLP